MTSGQTQRPIDSSASVESVPVFYFMCTAQSVNSAALGVVGVVGVVGVRVQECSSVVQEYNSIQALLFLDSPRRTTRKLFTE